MIIKQSLEDNLKSGLIQFFDSIDKLLYEKTIISQSANHVYKKHVGLATSEFSSLIVRLYGVDSVVVDDSSLDVSFNDADAMFVRSVSIRPQRAIVYAQLAKVMILKMMTGLVSDVELLDLIFETTCKLLIKDGYLTRTELNTVRRRFNKIFDVPLECEFHVNLHSVILAKNYASRTKDRVLKRELVRFNKPIRSMRFKNGFSVGEVFGEPTGLYAGVFAGECGFSVIKVKPTLH